MPIDLDAIEARANAATPGPLVVVPCGVDDLGWDIDTPTGDFPAGIRGAFGRREDADFHAHAPDDVPALVAHVRELEAALAEIALLAAQGAHAMGLTPWEWANPTADEAAERFDQLAALARQDQEPAPEGGA